MREAAQIGGEAGESVVEAAARVQRGREARGVATAHRGLRLDEELLQGLEHLAEAAVRVGKDEEVLKQLPRPRRCRDLRAVELVNQAPQKAAQVVHPLADPHGARCLRRCLGPPEYGLGGVVEGGDGRVGAAVEAGGAGAGSCAGADGGQSREPLAEPHFASEVKMLPAYVDVDLLAVAARVGLGLGAFCWAEDVFYTGRNSL